MSLLWIASYQGHVNGVKELFHNSTCSTEFNICNNKGATPLWIASQEGHADTVKELLQHSTKVYQYVKDGFSPLQIACYKNNIDVVCVLLQCVDVDVNLCDDNGGSSLYLASQEGHFDVKILLQHFAKVNTCKKRVFHLCG
ncbi:ankyrin repeat domain-containing protein 29-like [Mytilus edulis]|uniref:ankyrin repeat domain-containing protein 29-like n=1 Tax=Mytilus edulis TaxID=6550 RepID=UPI0039F02EB9